MSQVWVVGRYSKYGSADGAERIGASVIAQKGFAAKLRSRAAEIRAAIDAARKESHD